MKYVLSVICGFLAIAGSPERGHAHNEIAQLVPSPGCIQTILNQGTRVDAAQCLVELAALDAREGRKLRERDVRAAEREGREADEARRAVALAEAAKDESELVRRAARELRERLRLALSDAREGRERQRALRAMLASERRRLDDAYDREGYVRRAA